MGKDQRRKGGRLSRVGEKALGSALEFTEQALYAAADAIKPHQHELVCNARVYDLLAGILSRKTSNTRESTLLTLLAMMDEEPDDQDFIWRHLVGPRMPAEEKIVQLTELPNDLLRIALKFSKSNGSSWIEQVEVIMNGTSPGSVVRISAENRIDRAELPDAVREANLIEETDLFEYKIWPIES